MSKLMLVIIFGLLTGATPAKPQDFSGALKTRHDTVKNAIRDVRAEIVPTNTTIIGNATGTIIGNVGDPIPGCVGKVCGGAIQSGQ